MTLSFDLAKYAIDAEESPAYQRNPTRGETIVRVSLIGVLVVVTLGWFARGIFETPLEADNFTNGYSTSPAGHSALLALLEENKRTVKRGHANLNLPPYEYTRTNTLALMQPGPQYVAEYHEEFETLFDLARDTDTSVMLILPKRYYQEAPEQPEDGDLVLWESEVSLGEVKAIWALTGFDQWLDVQRVSGKGRRVIWLADGTDAELQETVQVFSVRNLPSNMEVLAETDSGQPVVMRYRKQAYSEGGVILVSEPDLFTNRYIEERGAGTFAMNVFGETPKNGDILVDEDLHGYSTDASLEYLAATPPGLWVTLSVFVLLGIFGWRQATVLRPAESEKQDRRARKFSIEGLARMMERAGDHDQAYRRLMWRSRLVLGAGKTQVQGAGKQATKAIRKGKTGRITRVEGATTLERLINAARRVAHQKRTGEAASDDWQ